MDKKCKKCGSSERGLPRKSSPFGDCKNCARVRAEEWASRNSGKKIKYNAAWHKRNKEKVIERIAKYKQSHPEICRVHAQNYRAKKAQNGGRLSLGIADRLLKLQKSRCAICKCKLGKYHMDHIMPISLGGKNVDENIQILCPTCNCTKNAHHPIDYMQSLGYLI